MANSKLFHASFHMPRPNILPPPCSDLVKSTLTHWRHFVCVIHPQLWTHRLGATTRPAKPSPQGPGTLAVSRWIARLYVGDPMNMVNSMFLEGAEQTPKNGSPSTQGTRTLAVSRRIARVGVGDPTVMVNSISLEGADAPTGIRVVLIVEELSSVDAPKAASKNGSPSPKGLGTLAASRSIARLYVGETISMVNSTSLERAEPAPTGRLLSAKKASSGMSLLHAEKGAEQTPKNGSPSPQGAQVMGRTLAVSRWIARVGVGEATPMVPMDASSLEGAEHAPTGNPPVLRGVAEEEEEGAHRIAHLHLHAHKEAPIPGSTVPETFPSPSPTSGPTPTSSSPAPSSCDGPRPPVAATPCLSSKSRPGSPPMPYGAPH